MLGPVEGSWIPRRDAQGCTPQKRMPLPSGRWVDAAGSTSGPKMKLRNRGTQTQPRFPTLTLRIVSKSTSTQTRCQDWITSNRVPNSNDRGLHTVIESQIFVNSSYEDVEDERPLDPPPEAHNTEGDGLTPGRDPPQMEGEGLPPESEATAENNIPGETASDSHRALEEEQRADQPNGPDLEPALEANPTATTVGGANTPVADGIEVFLEKPGVDLECPLCRVQIGKIRALVNHFEARHPVTPVMYVCRKCGKADEKSHSIKCHIPKCKGIVAERAGEFKCELCQSRFGTGAGLATHTRLAHPAVHNEAAKAKKKAAEKVRITKKLWTPEEDAKLPILITKYLGRPKVNDLIAAELGTGKSGEQVRSRRRVLAAKTIPNGEDLHQEQSEGVVAGPNEAPAHPSGPELAESVAVRLRAAIDQSADDGSEMRVLANLMRDVDRDPLWAERQASEVMRQLGKGNRNSGQRGQRNRRTEPLPDRNWARRLAQSRKEYRQQQMLFARDPSKLAALVLDGAANAECTLPVEHVLETYRGRWEAGGTFEGLGDYLTGKLTKNEEFCRPILAAEVMEYRNRCNKKSAPGPDKVGMRDILAWDPGGEKCAQMFTVWLVQGKVPDVWKEARTTLLPKSDDPETLRDVSGWRPVTIGSQILRLFSGIVGRRLSAASPLNPRQRGFIDGSEGCSGNLMILNGIIARARGKGTGLAVAFIDLSKAFDTVSHGHILACLEERMTDPHIVGLIQNLYVNCSTRIAMGAERTPPIAIKLGVKQGDPMSPLLFNLAMDPLIQALEDRGEGLKVGDSRLSVLAFADDLVLLSGDETGMRRNLDILEKFCHRTGLKINPGKSHGFFLNKGVVNDCVPWQLCGTPIHMVGAGETVRYLGVEVGPVRGITKPDLGAKLSEWVKRISKAPLKPTQKVVLLNSFAVPRLIYQADHCNLPVTTLTLLDVKIRSAVRTWLHLAPSGSNGLIYARNGDGGLGITKLEGLVPSIQIRRLYRLAHSNDEWVRHLTLRTVSEDEWRKRWARSGGNPEDVPWIGHGPGTGEVGRELLVKRKLSLGDWRRSEAETWAALPVQGVGVGAFMGDKVSNDWLNIWNPARVGFKQRHIIAALALRNGTYPTKEFLARGRNKSDASCRWCQARLESASHILGQCPKVHGARIRRHHKLRDLLGAEAAAEGWKVHTEFRVTTPEGELRIPDLVCVRQHEALVIDVTVRYETGEDTLERAAEEKVARYTPVLEQIAEMAGVSHASAMGFPVGARGKWPTANSHVLSKLGIDGNRGVAFAKLVSRRVLLYSLDVLAAFK